jgi:hypothetical protein
MKIALRIDEAELAWALAAFVDHAPRGLFPDGLVLPSVDRDDVGAPFHHAKPVVESVAEFGDVEVRDVR